MFRRCLVVTAGGMMGALAGGLGCGASAVAWAVLTLSGVEGGGDGAATGEAAVAFATTAGAVAGALAGGLSAVAVRTAGSDQVALGGRSGERWGPAYRVVGCLALGAGVLLLSRLCR
jgi:hypothetical protein